MLPTAPMLTTCVLQAVRPVGGAARVLRDFGIAGEAVHARLQPRLHQAAPAECREALFTGAKARLEVDAHHHRQLILCVDVVTGRLRLPSPFSCFGWGCCPAAGSGVKT